MENTNYSVSPPAVTTKHVTRVSSNEPFKYILHEEKSPGQETSATGIAVKP